MVKLRIIGVDADIFTGKIDMVLSEFDGEKIRDICSDTVSYDTALKNRFKEFMQHVSKHQLNREQLLHDRNFITLHWQYIENMATAVKNMCAKFGRQKSQIDAIGFTGQKLAPYVDLQMGSGQLAANLTGIPVIYDFHSALTQNGSTDAMFAGAHYGQDRKSVV